MVEFVRVSNLKPGDVLARAVVNDKLQILLAKGNKLTAASIKIVDDLGYKGCYIHHDTSDRREDVPLYEPILDEIDRLIFIKKLKDLFQCRQMFVDPMDAGFKKLRSEIEGMVKDLVKAILKADEKGTFLYETEDCMRTVKNWIYHHSLNTCIISVGIAVKMGLPMEDIVNIGTGAIYHDLGKAYFGEELYNKPEITDEDKAELRTHPEIMFRVFQRLNYPIMTSYAIWQHHEKIDGSGYPMGLVEKRINLSARITALASAFDNFVNMKAYDKEVMSQCDAFEYLQGCNDYSIECMRALFKFIVPYPIGAKVILSSGQQGIVLKNVPGFVMRPYVIVGNQLYDLAFDMKRMNETILGVVSA